MTATPKKLIQGSQLTASAATYYTAPANTRTLIKKVTLTNNDTVARTATIYLVPTAGTAGVTNLLTKAASIAAGSTYEAFEAEGHILQAGDFIQALADTTLMVTIQASGVEIV